jgi:predicted ATP-binding protein involved in virulence
MKIAKLVAQKVHGYLPINVEFFDDLTFLTGLNGSGKTSALRLLIALLTPNLDELGSIAFSDARVTVHDTNKSIVVKAHKTLDAVTLSISSLEQKLQISISDMELYMDVRRRDESKSLILEKYQKHPVFQAIRTMSTPMFLGLDRRFFTPSVVVEDMNETRRREYMTRRFIIDDPSTRGSAVAALAEVNYLVQTKVHEIRASQEQLDDRLRSEFFSKAFEYKPSDLLDTPPRLLARSEIDRYRKQLSKIEREAEGVNIPVPEIQAALTLFFEKMSHIVDVLGKSTKKKTPPKKGERKSSSKLKSSEFIPDKEYIEWIINRPQADRILEHLKMLDEYIANRTALHDPITRFLMLVNKFFAQTNKHVSTSKTGQLQVEISGSTTARQITALSSGERQLLVMLAHLSLNPSLTDSGVFIVDEPELSLHIDWQEKFVDAVREANPNVQLILATHSPAIILDRDDACRTLSGADNA